MDSKQFPDVVELNVGGKLLATLLSTLTKDPDSMLAAMFSGRHVINKDKDGRYFIDCDGHLFEYILNFLRFGVLPPKEKALEVFDMAVYFGIQSLVMSVESYSAVQHRKRIEEIMKNKIDIEEYERLKQEAIKQLYNCYARPQDTKVLHVRLKHVKNTSSCFSYVYQKRLEKGGIHIVLLTDYNVIEDIAKTENIVECLAHDMCQLGFGKYAYFDGPFSYDCRNEFHEGETVEYKISLVEHKIIPK